MIPLHANWTLEPFLSSDVLLKTMITNTIIINISSLMPTLDAILLRVKWLGIFTKVEEVVGKCILSIRNTDNFVNFQCRWDRRSIRHFLRLFQQLIFLLLITQNTVGVSQSSLPSADYPQYCGGFRKQFALC